MQEICGGRSSILATLGIASREVYAEKYEKLRERVDFLKSHFFEVWSKTVRGCNPR